MASFGVSFVPGGQGDPGKSMPEGQAGGAPPLQQAIQLLSLRLPRVVGANGLAPGPLLNAPGGMGGTGNPLLEALLRLAGMSGGSLPQQGTPMAAPQSFGGASPTRIIPGEGDRRPGTPLLPPPPAGGPTLGAGPMDRAMGPGVPTFPGVPGGSPMLDRRGPFSRGM